MPFQGVNHVAYSAKHNTIHYVSSNLKDPVFVWQAFSKAAKDYRRARTRTKQQHYNALIVEAGKDQGELF